MKPDGDIVHAGVLGVLGVVGFDDDFMTNGKIIALGGGDGIVAKPALAGGSEYVELATLVRILDVPGIFGVPGIRGNPGDFGVPGRDAGLDAAFGVVGRLTTVILFGVPGRVWRPTE